MSFYSCLIIRICFSFSRVSSTRISFQTGDFRSKVGYWYAQAANSSFALVTADCKRHISSFRGIRHCWQTHPVWFIIPSSRLKTSLERPVHSWWKMFWQISHLILEESAANVSRQPEQQSSWLLLPPLLTNLDALTLEVLGYWSSTLRFRLSW